VTNNERCAACQRSRLEDSRYCEDHETAHKALVSAFEKWLQAYGEINWEMYLDAILKIHSSGQWVKEAAQAELRYLHSSGESQ
jgi:hypothetical protein